MMNYCAICIRFITAAVLLFLLSPIILPIMMLIWLESKGAVVFTQTRIGKDLKPFTIYKLRTMTALPHQGKDALFSKKEAYVTRVGRVLRILKLDECLQLINILKGNMNFLGPRPLRDKLHQHYMARIPGFQDRYRIAPGIMGLSQIVDETIEDRTIGLAFDLYYIRHKSLKLNAMIVVATIPYMLHKILARVYVHISSYWLHQVENDASKHSTGSFYREHANLTLINFSKEH